MGNQNVSRISVKIEVTPEDYSVDDRDLELVKSTFDKALEQIGHTYENVIDKFFTIRFDETQTGIAATVSAAEKRDN